MSNLKQTLIVTSPSVRMTKNPQSGWGRAHVIHIWMHSSGMPFCCIGSNKSNRWSLSVTVHLMCRKLAAVGLCSRVLSITKMLSSGECTRHPAVIVCSMI